MKALNKMRKSIAIRILGYGISVFSLFGSGVNMADDIIEEVTELFTGIEVADDDPYDGLEAGAEGGLGVALLFWLAGGKKEDSGNKSSETMRLSLRNSLLMNSGLIGIDREHAIFSSIFQREEDYFRDYVVHKVLGNKKPWFEIREIRFSNDEDFIYLSVTISTEDLPEGRAIFEGLLNEIYRILLGIFSEKLSRIHAEFIDKHGVEIFHKSDWIVPLKEISADRFSTQRMELKEAMTLTL